jgi:hypothetical protein
MPEVVMVSKLEKIERLKAYIEELFKKKRYAEITQAIGMHSLLIDPQHTLDDQTHLYHHVLNLIKTRINKDNTKKYSSWLVSFPALMAAIAANRQVVTDQAAAEVLASHYAGSGPFTSVEAFFFWALDDRRLPLDQIVKYIEKTVEMQRRKA